jgi:hypothetical protein
MITASTTVELNCNYGDYNQVKVSHTFGITVNAAPGREGELDLVILGFNDDKKAIIASNFCVAKKEGKLNLSKLQLMVSEMALEEVKRMKEEIDDLEDKYVLGQNRREKNR